jgi:hypothetical protein
VKRDPAVAQLKAQLLAIDARLAAAAKPTGRPLPDWMTTPALLPKRPPGRPA